MIAFTVVAAAERKRATIHATRDPSLKWCRFDDETIYWERKEYGKGFSEEFRILGGTGQTAEGDLYLVVQAGNHFVEEFPRARVAINKGRYLAVEMTAEEVKKLSPHVGPCFGFCRCPRTPLCWRPEHGLNECQPL